MVQISRHLKPNQLNRVFTQYCGRTYSTASNQYDIKDNSIIFSGIQPTGIPHLGNYFGALDLWTKLQNEYSDKSKLIFCIVDLHSITLPQNPAELSQSIDEMATLILSCGIDSEKSVLFKQSSVPGHSQLSWVLSTVAPFGNLNRMTQWKNKLEQLQLQDSKATLDLGLFTYPVLQAADILLYDTNYVPVGEDQRQHMELTRVIADKFNRRFQTEVFKMPQDIYAPAKKIQSLQNPEKKMSKSDPNNLSRIELTDTPDLIKKKIAKALTDSDNSISYDPENRPSVSSLVQIYSSCADIPIEQVVNKFQGQGFREFKSDLTQVLVQKIEPIQKRYQELKRDPTYVKQVLKEGGKKADDLAQAKLSQVMKAVGL